MPRTKGSKNKSTVFKEEAEKMSASRYIDVDYTKKVEPPKPKPKEVKKEEVKETPQPQLEFKEVIPRVDHPKVPECLVDGGMLYRWLNDVRKTYIDEKVEKREVKIINEIMDYIMRMEKHERNESKNKEIERNPQTTQKE